MLATFDYAVRYLVTASCVTPLRTGGTDGDTEQLLRAKDGRLFMQASSIAGALRGWTEKNTDTKRVNNLFGTQSQSGHLLISDAVFADSVRTQIRPRLRIDGKTGAADDGGKFDIAQIERGAMCHFSIDWLGTEKDSDELQVVENLLAAIHSGEIRLGAQKTNGFGRLALSVKKQGYRMSNPEERKSWVANSGKFAVLELKDTAVAHDVLFTVSALVENLLVKGAAAEQEDGKGSFTPNITENGAAVIPGSSIKGVIRSQSEKIGHYVGISEDELDALFGRGAENGDNGIAGRVVFEDALVSGMEKRRITRIHIDRLTGGVMRGGLFKEEPVCGEVMLQIRVPDEEIACALILFALRDLGLGLCNLGSNGAIGRGRVSVDRIDIQTPAGKAAVLRFADGRPELEDHQGTVKTWLGAWKEAGQ